MNHWIVAPIVLPAILAPFIIMVLRYHLDLQRIFSVAGVVGLLGIALTITAQAAGGEIHVYELGDWPAPFGIVLVLDRLSAMERDTLDDRLGEGGVRVAGDEFGFDDRCHGAGSGS